MKPFSTTFIKTCHFFKVRDRQTGEIKDAFYGENRQYNLRPNVGGRFYTDKKFNQLFETLPK